MANSKTLSTHPAHQIRKIGELKAYLKKTGISPEMLSERIAISNMTIRRMLERKDSEKISEKYWPLFDRLLANESEASDSHLLAFTSHLSADFDSLAQDLEKAGMDVEDLEQVQDDVRAKMDSESIGKGLKNSLKLLLKTVSGPKIPMSSRAIALGALLYFLNPIDLIPDALPGVGYLDDFSVAGVAISAIVKKSKAADEEKKKKSQS